MLLVCSLSVQKAQTPLRQKEEKQAGSGIEPLFFFFPLQNSFFFFPNATLHDLQKKKKKYLEIWLVCEQGGKQKIQHKQRNRLYLRADRE